MLKFVCLYFVAFLVLLEEEWKQGTPMKMGCDKMHENQKDYYYDFMSIHTLVGKGSE